MLRHSNFLVASILILFALLSLLALANGVMAQSLEEEAVPVNLSRSGGANEPRLIVDGEGGVHLFWQDEFAGTIYAHRQGGEWSDPLPVAVPFSGIAPRLLLDPAGRVHALWLDEEGLLLHSRAQMAEVGQPRGWIAARQLAEAALAVDLAADSTGRLHLTYIRPIETAETPAGLYYRRSDDGGGSWSNPVLLYASAYFRALPPEAANLQVEVAEEGRLFVVWDNPSLATVLLARSPDSGQSWEPALEIDRREREDGVEAEGPSRIRIASRGKEVHLLWRAGHGGAKCGTYHRWSPDGGESWHPRQQLESLTDCPENHWLLEHGNEHLLLLVATEEQGGLAAWNGEQWSVWQPQATLAGFTSSETARWVRLGCHQPLLTPDAQLLVAACEQQEGENGDIWFASQSLGEPGDWFAPRSPWFPPSLVAISEVGVQGGELLAGAQGRLHLFWAPTEGTALTYAGREGSQWLPPGTILDTGEGRAGVPAVAATQDGRLVAVWSERNAGTLHFSQSRAGQAWIPEEWQEGQTLPVPHSIVGGYDILVDTEGEIALAYAVPINEGRGIYLMRSEERGRSWSDPVQVFDGEAAGWAVVDQPHLARSSDGHLHLLWTRYAPPGGSGPLALFYSRSVDGGESWSEPSLVTEATAIWSEIVALGERLIHRLWMEEEGEGTTLWAQFSMDGGQSWSRPTAVESAPLTSRMAAVTADGAGRLHLLQVADLTLRHWSWDGGRWLPGEELQLEAEGVTRVEAMAAAVTSNGDLNLFFAGPPANEEAVAGQSLILFTARPLTYPAGTPTPLPTLTPTPRLTATPVPTVTPSPTAMPALPPAATAPGASSRISSNRWMDLALAVIPASLIVLVVVSLRIRGVRTGRP